MIMDLAPCIGNSQGKIFCCLCGLTHNLENLVTPIYDIKFRDSIQYSLIVQSAESIGKQFCSYSIQSFSASLALLTTIINNQIASYTWLL